MLESLTDCDPSFLSRIDRYCVAVSRTSCVVMVMIAFVIRAVALSGSTLNPSP
jgi:hypothetical protein